LGNKIRNTKLFFYSQIYGWWIWKEIKGFILVFFNLGFFFIIRIGTNSMGVIFDWAKKLIKEKTNEQKKTIYYIKKDLET